MPAGAMLIAKMVETIPYKKIQKHLGSIVLAEERLDFKEGQIIFYEGHEPYGIYVLRKGRIRLYQKLDGGEEKLIQVLEPGNLFGEKAFLNHESYDANARAETDASVSFFSRVVFSPD